MHLLSPFYRVRIFQLIWMLVLYFPLISQGQISSHFLARKINNKPFTIIYADKSKANRWQNQFVFKGHIEMLIWRDTVFCDKAVFDYEKQTVRVYGHIKSLPLSNVNFSGQNEDGTTYLLNEGLIVYPGFAR